MALGKTGQGKGAWGTRSLQTAGEKATHTQQGLELRQAHGGEESRCAGLAQAGQDCGDSG